jgi:hypothetical protein
MVDSGCEVAAIPFVAWTGDRPGSSRLRMGLLSRKTLGYRLVKSVVIDRPRKTAPE